MRLLALAFAVALGLAVYFVIWFRWPTFLAIAAGATMGIVLLLVAASVGDDPADADAAWRAAAPDLAARERTAGGGERTPSRPDRGAGEP